MDAPDLAPVQSSSSQSPPSAVAGALFLIGMFVLALVIAFGAAGALTNWIKALPVPPVSMPL